MSTATKSSDKDRWNLLSPAASKSLAKEFDFGDAAKGGVVKGTERWNLLRDNVQSISLQARGVNAFANAGRPSTSPSQRVQLFSSTLRRAARQDKKEEPLESPGAISIQTASEPAPEPGVAGDLDLGLTRLPEELLADHPGNDEGEDGSGEEFSDWESEASKSDLEKGASCTAEGLAGHCSDGFKQSGLAILVQSPPDTSPPLGEVESGVRAEEETEETDPGHFILSNSVSAEVQKIEAVVVSSTAAADATAATEAPSTDLMSRMMGGLPSWGMFSAAESEDEVHNAWGEQDSEEMLGQRALELHQARGIELPGVPIETSAQARLAKRKQKAKAQAKRKAHLEVTNAEATGSHLFAGTSSMMSMLSNFTSMGRAVSSNADEEEVHNAWGDDTDSKLVERAAELEQARGIVVPMPQVQSTGRERLAKRRQKAQKQNNETVVVEADTAEPTSAGRVTASFFAAAATGIVQFQRLLNLTSSGEDEIDEVFCIWGEDDTPERYKERVVEMELARSDQSARLPHHRVIRQRRKGGTSPTKKDQDDPFLLDLQEQIE